MWHVLSYRMGLPSRSFSLIDGVGKRRVCVCVQGRAHHHYTCIAVDRSASQRAGVCVCLYVMHDAIIVFVVTVVV